METELSARTGVTDFQQSSLKLWFWVKSLLNCKNYEDPLFID